MVEEHEKRYLEDFDTTFFLVEVENDAQIELWL